MVEIVPRNVNLTRIEFQAIDAKIERERERKRFSNFSSFPLEESSLVFLRLNVRHVCVNCFAASVNQL